MTLVTLSPLSTVYGKSLKNPYTVDKWQGVTSVIRGKTGPKKHCPSACCAPPLQTPWLGAGPLPSKVQPPEAARRQRPRPVRVTKSENGSRRLLPADTTSLASYLPKDQCGARPSEPLAGGMMAKRTRELIIYVAEVLFLLQTHNLGLKFGH